MLPTLALSFFVTADTWLPIFLRDVGRAAALALGTPLSEFAEEGGPPDAIGGLEALRGLGDEVSCDIETDGIDVRSCKILCVGFTDIRSGRTAVLWPWKDEMSRELGAWLGKRKRVVFHNGFNFDLLVLRNHGVVW